MAQSEQRQRQRNGSSRRGVERLLPSVQVIGIAFVLLVLAGYFLWMIVEMGAHAVTGAWPMLGVFVAAIVGGAAATLGLVLGRRRGD
jgi:TRAP-type C4-dicarboxylate transport system permease small subunit